MNSFKNKDIMIIVPHQDDELNICGGMFTSDYFDMSRVKIVFSTNGDYLCNYKARVRETNRLVRRLKMKRENIIYLGYSDQYYNEDNHIYMVHEPNVFTSKKGDSVTFSNNYHFKKYGENNKFNYESFVSDIKEVILDNKPGVIFAIDFDSHPDHRALSLAFEAAMGDILKEEKTYRPLIYKAFAYPTYYKGIDDFNTKGSNKTKFNTEPYSLCEMENPYYSFNERISFPVKNNKILLFNKTYKLFKIYRSQLIIKRIYRILNDDMIFFQRRSDNLLYRGDIKTSSGKSEYINDFMLFDVSNLMNGNTKKVKLGNKALVFDKDDNKKEIVIKLDKKYHLKELVIYQSIYKDEMIKEIRISVNNKIFNQRLNSIKQSIMLDDETDMIKIRVIKTSGDNAGFSEIELFDKKEVKKVLEEDKEEYREDKLLKVINNITLCFSVFFARVINKIARITGRL